MNFKTAALGTMLTAGTVLGGCAKKEAPEAVKIMEKVNTELRNKRFLEQAFNAKDTVMFNAVKDVKVAEKAVDVAKAKLQQKMAELVFKRDSINFANKKNKDIVDTLSYKLSKSRIGDAEVNTLLEKFIKVASEGQTIGR